MDRDQELMIRTATGDSIAFEALFRKWERPVYAFLYRALGSGEAAEDCLQETFVKLWRSAPRYRPSYKVSTYLFRIATNAMIDQRRREGRHSRVAAPLSDCDGSASIDSLPSEASDPIDELVAKEVDEQLHAAIAELPLDQRTAFVLSHFSGLTYAEVAEITHTKVGTVASRKYAAVRALQKNLSHSLGGLRNEVR